MMNCFLKLGATVLAIWATASTVKIKVLITIFRIVPDRVKVSEHSKTTSNGRGLRFKGQTLLLEAIGEHKSRQELGLHHLG